MDTTTAATIKFEMSVPEPELTLTPSQVKIRLGDTEIVLSKEQFEQLKQLLRVSTVTSEPFVPNIPWQQWEYPLKAPFEVWCGVSDKGYELNHAAYAKEIETTIQAR
jgi:hypothetical protein